MFDMSRVDIGHTLSTEMTVRPVAASLEGTGEDRARPGFQHCFSYGDQAPDARLAMLAIAGPVASTEQDPCIVPQARARGVGIACVHSEEPFGEAVIGSRGPVRFGKGADRGDLLTETIVDGKVDAKRDRAGGRRALDDVEPHRAAAMIEEKVLAIGAREKSVGLGRQAYIAVDRRRRSDLQHARIHGSRPDRHHMLGAQPGIFRESAAPRVR
jgi:hypothetical protein